nr:DUF2188 domain-containing protein [uncultured Caldimonas sp.]
MATVGRTVSRRPDGKWANQKDGGERATSLHATQKQAADAARRNLRNEGGGELKVEDEKGKIREKDTIVPAKDPSPRRGETVVLQPLDSAHLLTHVQGEKP